MSQRKLQKSQLVGAFDLGEDLVGLVETAGVVVFVVVFEVVVVVVVGAELLMR